MSMLICPLCGGALERGAHGAVCPKGHNFDYAAAGYVHLLPANRKHAKDPGDDKGMAAARNRFLSGGWYAPLLQALEREALAHAPQTVSVLDSGCGEGYYTQGVCTALKESGRQVRAAGIDLSKSALRWAAKRCPWVEFAVASAYHLPVADESVDLLLNCFSPLAEEEFRRVVRPGGWFFYVVPGARHLWQLKEVLYERPYENDEQIQLYDGFRYEGICPVEGRIDLPDRESVHDLFQMTPYYWKTPRAGAQRLEQLEGLETEISFHIHRFRRL